MYLDPVQKVFHYKRLDNSTIIQQCIAKEKAHL